MMGHGQNSFIKATVHANNKGTDSMVKTDLSIQAVWSVHLLFTLKNL